MLFFVIRSDMHYVTSSCVSHIIIICAVLTPLIADIISNICLNRSTVDPWTMPFSKFAMPRWEEHTSELQPRGPLVCRLRLEKKTPTPWDVHVTTISFRSQFKSYNVGRRTVF